MGKWFYDKHSITLKKKKNHLAHSLWFSWSTYMVYCHIADSLRSFLNGLCLKQLTQVVLQSALWIFPNRFKCVKSALWLFPQPISLWKDVGGSKSWRLLWREILSSSAVWPTYVFLTPQIYGSYLSFLIKLREHIVRFMAGLISFG